MERCDYKEILKDADVALSENERNTWKPLLRQIMICSGIWCNYFMQGLFIGAPTVLIAQLRREAKSADAVTNEMSSWLSSLPIMSAIPLVLILPWPFYKIGRKITFLIVCFSAVISSIIFYNSKNLYHVLISQIFLGPSTAAAITLMPVLIAEYSSPKYRGLFLTIKSASTFWGIWVSNAIGTFFYWKNIAIVGFACSVYLTTVIAWPDSPHWLAMKGSYAESAKSHRWLKGRNEYSENELAELITFQKKFKILSLSSDTISLSNAWSIIKSPSFYKPALLSITLFAQLQFSGKFVISVYAIEVLKSLTQNESVAYKGMLLLDGITVFSMYGGCLLCRYLKRRIILLFFSVAGICFLYIMSLYLYLVSLGLIQENHIVIILILTSFSIAFGCGPAILASSIYGEIVPSRFRSSVMIIGGLCDIAIMSALLKFSPLLFISLNMHGYFLFSAVSSSIVVIILYIYLPETKDKTIQEIEEYFSGNSNTAEQISQML